MADDTKQIRRNMLLTQRSLDRLVALRARTEIPTDSELLRRSLLVFERLVEEIESGSRILLERKDGTTRELSILA